MLLYLEQCRFGLLYFSSRCVDKVVASPFIQAVDHFFGHFQQRYSNRHGIFRAKRRDC